MVLKSTGLAVQQFVECTRCLEASHDDSSVQEWTERHLRERPGHSLFRTVSTASWFLVPRQNTQDSADVADTPD
ncbi:DUF7848 domain-containing protein [Streptomyces sp. NPDC002285]